MATKPKTIQIYLPSGDPSGIRQAELTTSIVRVFEIPRNLVAGFLTMPESGQVGFYFLLGGTELDEVYIGQSGSVGSRLVQHSKDDSKDWEKALVVVSLTHSFTQTHVLYLESLSIQQAKKCERYKVSNGNSGQSPHTPTPLKADCNEIHELASILLTTLGYPIFVPLITEIESAGGQKLFCNRSGVRGEGFYTNEGLVVLKGSEGRLSTGGKAQVDVVKARDRLIDLGVLGVVGEKTVFLKDHLFRTPSAASCALLASNSNGWAEWKNSSGQTLRQIEGSD